MNFVFEYHDPGTDPVEVIWQTRSDEGGTFISIAESQWGLVVTEQAGRVMVTVHGPETHSSIAPVPGNATFTGVQFRLGWYMPRLPASSLVDHAIELPLASRQAFWLDDDVWELPAFTNADVFVEKLMRRGLLIHDPYIQPALNDQPQNLTDRTVQRHFSTVTGLTRSKIAQIERARHALNLLQSGRSIIDTVHDAGYADQAHLTRSMRQFVGQTPTQIIARNSPG